MDTHSHDSSHAATPTLAAQLAAAESDHGNIPDEETTDLGIILAHALGATSGGLVAALIQGAEDALFLYGQTRDIGLADMVIEDVQRRLVAARLLQRVERAAAKAPR